MSEAVCQNHTKYTEEQFLRLENEHLEHFIKNRILYIQIVTCIKVRTVPQQRYNLYAHTHTDIRYLIAEESLKVYWKVQRGHASSVNSFYQHYRDTKKTYLLPAFSLRTKPSQI